MALPSYLKEEDNKIIFNDPEGEVIYYIPEKYFDLSSKTEIIGEYVNVFGIFCWCYFDSKGKSHGIKYFKCPTIIKCKPNLIDKLHNFQLEGIPVKPSDYRCLHFTKGGELLSNTNIVQDADNVDIFVNLLTGGNLPTYIPYNEIQDYMIENAEVSNFNYKISNQVLGLLISELYRDKEDLSKPFRLSNSNNMTDYVPLKIQDVPKYISTYTSITSEDPSLAIAGAILNKGTPNTHSPLEKIVID